MNEELNEALSDIAEKLASLEAKLDDLESTVEEAAHDGAEDGAQCGMDDIDVSIPTTTGMMILSQDRKLFAPFTYMEAVRVKKGEEPYAINLSLQNYIGRRIGTYPNKEAALAEMEKIATAYSMGVKIYKMK